MGDGDMRWFDVMRVMVGRLRDGAVSDADRQVLLDALGHGDCVPREEHNRECNDLTAQHMDHVTALGERNARLREAARVVCAEAGRFTSGMTNRLPAAIDDLDAALSADADADAEPPTPEAEWQHDFMASSLYLNCALCWKPRTHELHGGADPTACDGCGGHHDPCCDAEVMVGAEPSRAGNEDAMVVLRRHPDGTPAVWCDPGIADVVQALNAGGVPTVASCSGHGVRPGNVALADGRELIVAADWHEAREVEAAFPRVCDQEVRDGR